MYGQTVATEETLLHISLCHYIHYTVKKPLRLGTHQILILPDFRPEVYLAVLKAGCWTFCRLSGVAGCRMSFRISGNCIHL